MAELAQEFSKEEQVKALLDRINAYIEHYHGGSVEMIELKGNVLKVKLGGACLGCPLSPINAARMGCWDCPPVLP